MWSAALTRGVDVGDAAAPGTLRLSYRVSNAWAPAVDGRLTLPLLIVSDATPPAALTGAFAATVTLPDGMDVRSSFPSELRTLGPAARAELQAVPRMIRARLVPGPLGPLGRISMMEGLATGLILLFGGLGWRHLQNTSGSAA